MFDDIYLNLRARDEGYTKALEAAEKKWNKLTDALDKFKITGAESYGKLHKLTSAVDAATKNFSSLQAHVDRSRAVLVGFAAAAGGLAILETGVKKVFAVFEKTLPTLEKTVQTSRRLGVSPEFVEGMERAAKNAGVSSKSYEQALTGIKTRLGQAQNENGKAIKSFNDLNLSYKKLAELSPENQIKAVAEAVKSLPEGKQLSAITDLITGGSGRGSKLANQLLPLLKDGEAGIDKMIASAARFGIRWNEDVAKAIERAAAANRDLESVSASWAEQLTAGLAPAMADLKETAVDMMTKLLDTGQVQEFAEGLGEALKLAASWAKEAFEFVEKLVNKGRSSFVAGSVREQTATAAKEMTDEQLRKLQTEGLRIQQYEEGEIATTNRNLGGVFNGGGAHFNAQEKFLKEQQVYNQTRGWRFLKKAGVDISALDGEKSTAYIEDVMNRLKAEQEKRDHTLATASAKGKENKPKTPAELRREAEAEKRRQLHLAEYYASRQKRFDTQQTKDSKSVDKAQDKIDKIAERKTDLAKEIAEGSGKKDRTFKAAQAGSVEAYRAAFAYTKADQTALKQLEEQKKIVKQEEQATKELKEIKIAITQRQILANMQAVSLF